MYSIELILPLAIHVMATTTVLEQWDYIHYLKGLTSTTTIMYTTAILLLQPWLGI